MDLVAVGIVPERADDPVEAAALMARDGAAVLVGRATDEAAAQSVAYDVLGERVLVVAEPALVREGGDKDRLVVGSDKALPLHSDGFAYGDRHCDYIFLLCIEQGSSGGASYLADAVAMLDLLRHEDPALASFLTEVPVDLTEPDMRPACSPVFLRVGERLAARVTPFMAPAPDDVTAGRTTVLLERWQELTWAVSDEVKRFSLAPGEALCVDNYRVLHGRDPYEGNRAMWRIWAWTVDGNGLPEGPLHSDSRYALADG